MISFLKVDEHYNIFYFLLKRQYRSLTSIAQSAALNLLTKPVSFFIFQTLLPSSARDVYYRDEIGNISTSNLHETDDGVELELRPRFPLFGGWKTNYYIGYNIPSYQYLFSKGRAIVVVVVV